MKIDDVVAAGAVAPNIVGAALVPVVEKENGAVAAGAAVCAPNPPKTGAVVAVETAGAPNILVPVDAGAVAPKPANAGVLVAAPNAGAAVLVVAPKIFVAAG